MITFPRRAAISLLFAALMLCVNSPVLRAQGANGATGITTGWSGHPDPNGPPPANFLPTNSGYCPNSPLVATMSIGLRNGEIEPATETFNTDLAARLAACTSGGVLEVVPDVNQSLYGLVVKPFTLPENVTLQIDAGVTIFGSLNPSDYQTGGITPAQPVATLDTTTNPVIGAININTGATHPGGLGCTTGAAVPVTFGTVPQGSGATATANVVGGVAKSFTVTAVGSGYSASHLPTVTLPGCTTQPSTIVLPGYGLSRISIPTNLGGSGYSAPVLDILPPPSAGGMQATAITPNLVTTSANVDVATLQVVHGGSGCPTDGPYIPVTFTGPSGTTPATATAYVYGGAVQSMTIQNHGAGYSSGAPTATVSGCGAQPTVTVTLGYPLQTSFNLLSTPGVGYTVAPPVWLENTCGFIDLPNQPVSSGLGCAPLVTVAANTDHTSHGSAIIGFGTIDGRGTQPLVDSSGNARTLDGTGSFFSQAMPSPCTGLTGNQYSWYCLATNAYQSVPNWHQDNPMLIYAQQASNFTLYGIRLINAPLFFVRWAGRDGDPNKTTGLVIWDTKIFAPYTARNTDGIDPVENLSAVYIHNTYISNGDDNIAVSSNGTGGVSDITIDHVWAYDGLGMSVGSPTAGGVSNVLFQNLYLAGSPNTGAPNQSPTKQAGLKLKSSVVNGGNLADVTYDDVCMINQVNPIYVDENWVTNWGNGQDSNPPDFKRIVFDNIEVLKDHYDANSGSFEFDGFPGDGSKYPPSDVNITWANIKVDGTVNGVAAGYLQVYEDQTAPAQTDTVPTAFQSLFNLPNVPTYMNTGVALPTDTLSCTDDWNTFPDYAIDLFVSIPPAGGGAPTESDTNMTVSAPNTANEIKISQSTKYTFNLVVTPARGTGTPLPDPSNITLRDSITGATYTNPQKVTLSNETVYVFNFTASGSPTNDSYYAWVVNPVDGTKIRSNHVSVAVTN